MPTTGAVAARLGNGTYQFRDDQWWYQFKGLDWELSVPLDGFNYEEGVAVIAACDWATLEENEAPPADEYERLKRQKDEILEDQQSDLERKLVAASETIAFWKRIATTSRDSNTLLRASVDAYRSQSSVLDELLAAFVAASKDAIEAHNAWMALWTAADAVEKPDYTAPSLVAARVAKDKASSTESVAAWLVANRLRAERGL